jgi:hypothetical protein
MRRQYWLLSFFLLITFLFPEFSFGSAERKCTIKQFVGTVKIRRGASTTWNDARPKMPLKEADALRTFIESEAELETNEGTVIKVGENTTIELSKLYGDSEQQNTSVKILNGAVLANVKKLLSTTSSFDFQTPTATAAIRGTIVGFEVSKEQTKVKVYEGKVFVIPLGSQKGIEIQPNQMGIVRKGDNAVAIEKIQEKSPVVLSTGSDTLITSDSAGMKNVKSSDTSKLDTSTVIDSTNARDTLKQSLNQSVPGSLTLTFLSPVEGTVINPLSQITVTGTVIPSAATITVNGKTTMAAPSGIFKVPLTAPEKSGDFGISVNADYQGKSKTSTHRVLIQQTKLQFFISSPYDGQEFKKPLITISGTASPGAEVTVMSMKLPVTANGQINGQIPIANEVGDYSLEFEATLDGVSQKINRRISYKPEYRFILTTPGDRQIVTSTMFTIKGEVLPVNAEVSVMGRRLSVSTAGQFSGMVTIPDEEGEAALEFEVIAPGLNRNETRRVIYKRPPDINRPQISASSAKSCWSITVFDRTIDEELTLFYSIDNVQDFKTMHPNESFCIPYEDGVHSYTVYAKDKSGNLSSTEILRSYPYLATTSWFIKMRKPSGSISIDLPPASPGGESSVYPVEFSIEKLPDDNMSLIREVNISNKTNGKKVTLRTFTENFIDADVELVRNKNNLIQIDVNDINNLIKSYTFQITIR